MQSNSCLEQVQLDEVAQSHVQFGLGVSKDCTTSGKFVVVFNQPHGEKLHHKNIAGPVFFLSSVFLLIVTLYSAWHILPLS